MKHLNFDVRPMGVGLESIAFQDTKYFDELTELVKKARAKLISESAFCNLVDKATFNHKGILTSTHIEYGMVNAWITPKWLTGTNPIQSREYLRYDDFFRNTSLADSDRAYRGLIDDQKARVGGFLSKIEHLMCLGSPLMFDDRLCSPEGAASVILHEVGHAYTFMQYSMGMCMFNIMLSQTSAELNKAKTYGEVKVVFKESAKAMGITDTAFIDEVRDTNNKLVQLEYFAANAAAMSKYIMLSDVSSNFTQNASEEIADIFAARHGAEKAVMEIRRIFASETAPIMQHLSIALSVVFAGAVTTGVAAVFMPIVAPITALLVCAGFYATRKIYNGAATRTGVTTGIQQIRKMQNQTIERLKSKMNEGNEKAYAELVEYVQSTIGYGDSLLADLKGNESLFFELVTLFNTDKRDARRMREYQDRLEALSANRLFVKAAQLRVA